MSTASQLQGLFQSRYDRSAWSQYLALNFSAGIARHPQPVKLPKSDIAKSGWHLGSISLGDDTEIQLFEIELEDSVLLHHNRVGTSSLLKAAVKESDAIWVVYHSKSFWRFSFIESRTVHTDEGRVEVRTDPKRFTYLLGQGMQCRTAAERISRLSGRSTIEEVENAFSVETLTEEFYQKIFAWYEYALSVAQFNDADPVQQPVHVIKIITRMVFLWFLREKDLVDRQLFSDGFVQKQVQGFSLTSAKHGSYYQQVLEPLFFGVLNKPIPARKFDKSLSAELRQAINRSPFINGGLFDPQTAEETKSGNTLRLPDALFFGPKGLITILEQYNFTAEENTPLEYEVALDPELLGKIFENLLASVNPETQITARKATGSFYTPREIVEYMVDESLVAYLVPVLLPAKKENRDQATAKPSPKPAKAAKVVNSQSQIDLPIAAEPVAAYQTTAEAEAAREMADRLRMLLTYTSENHDFSPAEQKKLVKALYEVRVIDPAVGSGAFPMGVLQKIVYALTRLEGNTTREATYLRKLKVIENCLYGVDIQPIAVQITKLRCFISLVIEQEVQTGSTTANMGIQPLPNLEFKFVAANSLLDAKLPYENNDVNAILESLKNQVQAYFRAETHEKANLKGEITGSLRKITQFQERAIQMQVTSIRKEEKNATGSKLKALHAELARQEALKQRWHTFPNLFDEKEVGFFNAAYFFPGLRDHSFDIVIGNPPYLGIQKLPQDMKKALLDEKYATFESTGDLYSLFHERGCKLLREGGVLCYITSRQWINAGYGSSMRDYLAHQTDPIQLIDFGKAKIFRNATVFVNILFLLKGQPTGRLRACLMPETYQAQRTHLAKWFADKATPLPNPSDKTWIISSNQNGGVDVAAIMNSMGKPLSDKSQWKNYDIDLNAGIKFGFNKAYHLDKHEKDVLIKLDKKNKKIIKPFLRGKDIKRWKYEYSDIYFINAHNGIRESGIQPIDVEHDYPTIYNRLKQYETDLKNREDQGHHWTNLRNCAYLEEFEKEKIVWIEISDRANFAYDDQGMYLTNSAYFLSGKHLKYLLAVLNSPAADWYFSQITAKIAGGRMRYTKQYVSQIPIPPLKDAQQEVPFVRLVDYLLWLHSHPDAYAKSTDLHLRKGYFEQMLQAAVYQLYFGPSMQQHKKDVLAHLQHLPDITRCQTEAEAIALIDKQFNTFFDQSHPLRYILYTLDVVPEIAAIRRSFNTESH